MAHPIQIPRLGWSLEEGVFVEWLRADGDAIEPDIGLGQRSVKFFETLDAKTGPCPRMLLAGNLFAGDHCRQRL